MRTKAGRGTGHDRDLIGEGEGRHSKGI